jgi:hypothetical protein
LSELAAIDPIFGSWKFSRFGHRQHSLSPVGSAGLLEVVEAGRFYNNARELMPELGFRITADNSDDATSRSIVLDAHLGCTSTRPSLENWVILNVGLYSQTEATIITLPVFVPVLIAMVRACDAGWGRIAPLGAVDFGQPKPKHKPSWAQIWSGWAVYLSAPMAARITPPRSTIVEAVPGGGMLMIATEETFEPDNPEHFRVACDIQAALAPLNALPWPPDLSVARNL